MSILSRILQMISNKAEPVSKEFDRSLEHMCGSDTYGGEYAELLGTITQVDEFCEDEYHVTVRTDDYGVENGYIAMENDFSQLQCPPEIGNRATIRVYRPGGGWYPDDMIVAWWKANTPITVYIKSAH